MNQKEALLKIESEIAPLYYKPLPNPAKTIHYSITSIKLQL